MAANGDIVWSGIYRTYGNLAIAAGQVAQHLRFQGQYYDEESGLHYNRYRYYDPLAGRYISQDPIGLASCSSVKGYDAHNSANYQKLKDFYGQAEKYSSGGVKSLENGRYRFYGDIKPSRTPGEMHGARLVREWDPTSGNKRTWYETVDHSGHVRSVALKPVMHEKNHHIFNSNGEYMGRR